MKYNINIFILILLINKITLKFKFKHVLGLYNHVTGDFICDHGVKLIGWGLEDGYKYWLLMNSFGPLWGENGLFKIPMDGTDNTDFGYAIIGPKF